MVKLFIVFKYYFYAIICFVTCIQQTYSQNTSELKSGKGKFIYFEKHLTKNIPVWYYLPEKATTSTKILFVMHGVKRNAEEYRDQWEQLAINQNFVLLVPEFSNEDFPKSRSYNLGNIFSKSGEKNDESIWTYTIIENIFDHFKSLVNSKAEKYSIYGHSAGAQFVHRMVLFKPQARLDLAISANAGWYTLPSFDLKFPYGLKNSGIEKGSLKESFHIKLLILLGEDDTDENNKYLRKTAEAMLQGKHRYERGINFFNESKKMADENEIEFDWEIKSVPGVGHSNSDMSKFAIKEIF